MYSRDKEPNLERLQRISCQGRHLPRLEAQEIHSQDQEHDAEVMPLKNIQVLSLGSRMPVPIHGKRVIAGLERGTSAWITWLGPKCNHLCPHKREGVQGLRLHLPLQETRIPTLVRQLRPHTPRRS